MKNNFLVIITLYRKKPKESSTIVSLSKFSSAFKKNIRVLIWDNSPEELQEAQRLVLTKLLEGSDFEYIHNKGENRPLSKIYNDSINYAKADEFVVIFDDDSVFSEEMFSVAKKAINSNPDIDLFLPVVYFKKDIVSPAYKKLFKGDFLKQVPTGIMKCKNRTAINSGMIIKAEYLKNGFPGYDERITFYGTDDDFMSRYNETHKEFYVIDYKMQHTLNFYSTNELFEKKAARYVNQRKALFIIMRRKGLAVYLATQIYWFLYSIKYALCQRNAKFIFLR